MRSLHSAARHSQKALPAVCISAPAFFLSKTNPLRWASFWLILSARGIMKKPLRAFSGCSAVGSAPALGAGCRRFESCHSDQKRGVPSGGAPHFSSKGNREPAASLFKLPPGCAGACAAQPQVRILSLGPKFTTTTPNGCSADLAS